MFQKISNRRLFFAVVNIYSLIKKMYQNMNCIMNKLGEKITDNIEIANTMND